MEIMKQNKTRQNRNRNKKNFVCHSIYEKYADVRSRNVDEIASNSGF